MKEDNFPVPKGYKKIVQTEMHIEHIGQRFYKRDAEGNLVMAFWIRPENGNSGGVAHGGMLMSLADYCLCSAAMESKEIMQQLLVLGVNLFLQLMLAVFWKFYPIIDKETKV